MRRYRIEHIREGWQVLGEPGWLAGKRAHETRWTVVHVAADQMDAYRYVSLVQARQLALLGFDMRTGLRAA